MQLLGVVFFNFLSSNYFLNVDKNIFASALESCKAMKTYRKVYKKVIVNQKKATDLFCNKSVIEKGSDSMVFTSVSGCQTAAPPACRLKMQMPLLFMGYS